MKSLFFPLKNEDSLSIVAFKYQESIFSSLPSSNVFAFSLQNEVSIRSTWCGCFPKLGWVTHKHTITHSFSTTHMKKYLDSIFLEVYSQNTVTHTHTRTDSTSVHANMHALSEDVITWVSLLSVSCQSGGKTEVPWLLAALKAYDSLSVCISVYPTDFPLLVDIHLQKFLTNHSL